MQIINVTKINNKIGNQDTISISFFFLHSTLCNIFTNPLCNGATTAQAPIY